MGICCAQIKVVLPLRKTKFSKVLPTLMEFIVYLNVIYWTNYFPN